MDTNTKALLEKIPTKDLLRAARERNAQERRVFGPFAAQKKLSPCPVCKGMFGVREMRRHRSEKKH